MTVFDLLGGVLAAAIAGMLTVLVLKGKYGMLALGVLVRLCWVIGAIRLAKPGSVWARTFYDGERLAESVRRFPDAPGAAGARPARPPSDVPRPVRLGGACLALALVSALTSPAAGLLAGPALVMLPFLTAGLRWARIATFVLAGLAAVLATLLLARAHPGVLIGLGTVRLLLLGGAAHLLLRDPAARRHLASRPTPEVLP